MDHTCPHRSRGIGHDADHGVIFPRHLLDARDGKSCRHAAQDEAARPLVQGKPERSQQGLHHLGLDRQKDQVGAARHFGIRGGVAAQLCGQRLCLGGSAVGKINVLWGGSLADGPRNGTAHVPTA